MIVTIHTDNKAWKNAEIVSVGKDTLTGDKDVLVVRHPDFEDDLDFYAKSDDQGKHHNVGNAAFYVTME